ncbi:hypothetical protein PFICI_09484 [Pestalotiopsis fici W106-1]|uniref:Uncharacterized protein n=1 Tax=Pestalotiopsis fici (strain W106-1 / CGMCC3.15140) TaxID=1229662 RepID=W3X3A7_PESFW|nr:uncharacterized protein PFICI_09484 [Pestalotiopsis fici W106-1]ETS79631.1 hypothetical protein PFICI_09484 [Pestalotiopsis fici W106-1]
MHGWNIYADVNAGDERTRVTPHVEGFTNSIQSAFPSWPHPLLLPVILLNEHISRGEALRDQIIETLQDISGTLGVTASGRLINMEITDFKRIRELMIHPQERITLTARINTTITNAINCLDVLRWNARCRERIAACFQEIESSLTENAKNGHKELLDYFAFMDVQATELSDFVESLKLRLELQLSVLNNLVAQVDNDVNYDMARLSVKIAQATGLDSTAMKTLAIVTAVFLPPTFIAPSQTLFSMSMFDWSSSESTDSDSPQVVASTFWIYWAVSVPLTLLILVAFRLWWRRQKDRYAEMYGMDNIRVESTDTDASYMRPHYHKYQNGLVGPHKYTVRPHRYTIRQNSD